MAVGGVVILYRFREVHVGCDVRAGVPFGEKTFEYESGFADSTRAVENEGLRDAGILGVVA